MGKIRWFLVVIFVSMIVIGVTSGEMNIMLNKAIKICMECIGIG